MHILCESEANLGQGIPCNGYPTYIALLLTYPSLTRVTKKSPYFLISIYPYGTTSPGVAGSAVGINSQKIEHFYFVLLPFIAFQLGHTPTLLLLL